MLTAKFDCYKCDVKLLPSGHKFCVHHTAMRENTMSLHSKLHTYDAAETYHLQSSVAVLKSRWTSWAPVPTEIVFMVSVEAKQLSRFLPHLPFKAKRWNNRPVPRTG